MTSSECTIQELGGLPDGDRDPVAIIQRQNESRLQDLVPVRIGRMLESPFAYYRGTAATMAADLAASPSSGIRLVCCGDAHISNFGFYASPGRELVFDLNDFDEAGIAPWDWDVRRLATSVYLAALDIGAEREEADGLVRACAKAYRRKTIEFDELSALDRYYASLDVSELRSRVKGRSRRLLDKTAAKARNRTSAQALGKLTVEDGEGIRRIVDQPPLTRHVPYATPETLSGVWEQYLASTRQDIFYLLSDFTFVDAVLRVVGVGSVGTRCFIVLLADRKGAPLFLQIKEAQPTVLETFGGIPQENAKRGTSVAELHGDGFRVVAGQRILQAHSDPFLGWIRGYAGEIGRHAPVDYYWRQFRDMKGSIDLAKLSLAELEQTAVVCAGVLARAHAQSPESARAAAFLREGRGFAKAMAAWSKGYAEQCMRDYEALRAAASAGRVPVEYGV